MNFKKPMLFKLLILFIALSLIPSISCSPKEKIDKNSIKVEKINRHPFLIDHCKKLIVFNKRGKRIDEIEMYCDPGEGCKSYLFETKDKLIVIECNGQWYTIDRQSGNILKDTWQWEKQLPEKYIGTYIRDSNNEFYNLIAENNVTIQAVYKFKDPQ